VWTGVSPSGPAFGDYRLHSTIGHVGLDAMLEGNYGTAVLGLTVNPIDASALFRNFASTRMKMTGYTWSGYAFWVDGSWRAGLQAGTGRVKTHFTDSYVGTDAKVAMNTFSIQGAAAYTGRLDEGTWYEPSAVIGYTTLDGGSFTNGAGDTVSFGDTGSVLARLGLRVGRIYELGWGALKPHVDVAVRYEAEGTTSVAIGNFAYSSGLGGASGQVGGGATLEIGDGVRLFADALYSGGAKVSGWQGSVGLRLTP
jgi:outer membrane autotransporter protein